MNFRARLIHCIVKSGNNTQMLNFNFNFGDSEQLPSLLNAHLCLNKTLAFKALCLIWLFNSLWLSLDFPFIYDMHAISLSQSWDFGLLRCLIRDSKSGEPTVHQVRIFRLIWLFSDILMNESCWLYFCFRFQIGSEWYWSHDWILGEWNLIGKLTK